MNKYKIAFLAGILSVFAVAGVALANPSFFNGTVQTATATTTYAVIGSGLGTTTLIYNTYSNNSNATGTPTGSKPGLKADSIAFLVRDIASSSSAVLHITFEYSQNGTDWYQNYIPLSGFTTATSTNALGVPYNFTMTYASSTLAGAVNSVDTAILQIPVPTQDVRAVLTSTGATSSVWAQFVPTEQAQ